MTRPNSMSRLLGAVVRRLTAAAMLVALAATAAPAQSVGTVTGPIEASGGVSVGPDGRIYLADFGPALGPAGGQNVYRVTPQGKVELFATGFGGASGNHFGQDGFLYQSDIGRGEVYRVAPDGQRTRIAKDLKDPVGVTPGPGGVVYVAQCGAGIVSRIQPDGTVETVAQGKPLHCPNGLILGPDGALYTSNFFDGSVVRIALPSGAMTVLATVPGGGNGHLTARNGRLYVASFRGNRIFEVTLQGAVCPLAGSGAAATADGEPSVAGLFHPNGVAFSPDGDTLYVNTMARIVEAGDSSLHPNALRRISGLSKRPPCAAAAVAAG